MSVVPVVLLDTDCLCDFDPPAPSDSSESRLFASTIGVDSSGGIFTTSLSFMDLFS